MAAKGWSGVSGSTQVLFYSFFLLLFGMIALVFNEKVTGSRAKQRYQSNKNPRDEGNVCALLLCCWLLLLPLGQHINVNKQIQSKRISQDVNGQPVNMNKIQRLNFFGHGYLAIYLITKRSDHHCRGRLSKQNNRRRRGNLHDFNVFLILILLSGDVQLNPGPTTWAKDNMQEPMSKPKGILGGHLNIRSILPKRDQIEHLLTDSNLDFFLALSETSNIPD